MNYPCSLYNLQPIFHTSHLREPGLLLLLRLRGLLCLALDVGVGGGLGGGAHGLLLLLLAHSWGLDVVRVHEEGVEVDGRDGAEGAPTDDAEGAEIEAQEGDEEEEGGAHLGVEEEAEVAGDVLGHGLELRDGVSDESKASRR